MVTGHCRCGAVVSRIDGALADASVRHGIICRRLSGSASGACGAAAPAAPDPYRGNDARRAYRQSDAVTRRCRTHCGAPLPETHGAEPDAVFGNFVGLVSLVSCVSLGALGDDCGVGPEHHPFDVDAAPRGPVTADLPCHPGRPPASP